jgi:hypothetical protein
MPEQILSLQHDAAPVETHPISASVHVQPIAEATLAGRDQYIDALCKSVAILAEQTSRMTEKMEALEYAATRRFDWGAFFHTIAKWVKLFICIGLDLFDFTFGRLIGLGIGVDIGSALICMAMWGKGGAWAFWELLDITEQFDAFVPTCTIIAIRSWDNN